MFHIGSKRTSATYGALIDVGSGSVGVGIVESDQRKDTPQVIWSHRELMRVSNEIKDREEKIRQMREAFFSASLVLSTEGLKTLAEKNPKATISRILVTCGSPWSHTISRNVSYTSDKNVEVTSSLIDNLVADAEEKIEETLDESALVGKLGLHVVERATTAVRINGYTVHEAIGKHGKEIELSHIIGLIPEEILETVHEVQEKILTDTQLSAHTFMLVNYCIMRDIIPETESLCIVDVTGESTEVGIVEEGVLRESRHAPYGSHTLLRDVAKKANSTGEHALSLLRAYADGTLSDDERTRIEGYLKPYNEALSEVFSTLHKHHSIPTMLSVTALSQLDAFFRAHVPVIAQEISNSEETIAEASQAAFEGLSEGDDPDIFIALASRFFHKLHGCGQIDTL